MAPMKSKSWCSSGQLLMLMFAGWINRHQQAVIAYQKEEIKVLREMLGGKRRWLAQLLLPRSGVNLGRFNNGILRPYVALSRMVQIWNGNGESRAIVRFVTRLAAAQLSAGLTAVVRATLTRRPPEALGAVNIVTTLHRARAVAVRIVRTVNTIAVTDQVLLCTDDLLRWRAVRERLTAWRASVVLAVHGVLRPSRP